MILIHGISFLCKIAKVYICHFDVKPEFSDAKLVICIKFLDTPGDG